MEKEIKDLQQAVDKAIHSLNIVKQEPQIAEYEALCQDPDFWTDHEKASATTRELAKLKSLVVPWRDLESKIHDLQDMIELNDPSLVKELTEQLSSLKTEFDKLNKARQFSGKYDDHDAIVSIHAGAGGVDAMDWAQMLQRMYTRFGEISGLKTELIEDAPGEQAGVKHVILRFEGMYAYGKLRGEHGVHRLVRLSPFNADHLRQTSFALVEVLPEIAAPDEVIIDDKELRIDVFRAGGHGGQSVNTTDSAVRVTHLPTGITVSIQNERSQLQNKQTALKILRSKLARQVLEQHTEAISQLKGPDIRAEWGQQIRNYVLHPYTQVKDARTQVVTKDAEKVLDGDIQMFIDAYLNIQSEN